MQQNSNNEILTEREAASMLGVCDRTLRKLRKEGRIPAVPIGRQIRYLRSQLLAWMQAGGTGQKAAC